MRKHMRENDPGVFCIPQNILRQKHVGDDSVEEAVMMIKTTGDHDDQLQQDDREKNCNVDNDQTGNRITCLKLKSNVVNDGSEHFIKCRSYHPKRQMPRQSWMTGILYLKKSGQFRNLPPLFQYLARINPANAPPR